MGFESAISIIGTLVTIGCAAGSIYGWRKSKAEATKAELAVKSIKHNREIGTVSILHSETQKILIVLSKIGPATHADRIKGLNTDDIASSANEFLTFLTEKTHDIAIRDKLGINLDEFCNEFKDNIVELADSITPEGKLRAGRKLHEKASQLLPLTRKLADSMTINEGEK